MTDLGDIVWGDMDCSVLIQDRDKWGGGAVVNTVMNLRVPQSTRTLLSN
jgi:hypothetical protein